MSAVLSRRLLDAGPILRRFILGSANFPQRCALGIRDPQSEVSVWLEGAGKPIEVTQNNVMVAARPLIIGVGFGQEHDWTEIRRRRPVLKFRTMAEGRPLGDILLRMTENVPLSDEHLCLFETVGSRNYCVPKMRLWIRHLDEACRRWRSERHSEKPGFRMRAGELRSVFAFYICPRPVVLVSVVNGQARNIFPMDLIGPVGSRHFALSLHNSSAPLRLMEQSRRIALSSVPIDQSSVAFELGKNHNASDVDLCSLPFTTTASTVFDLPVPRFALRVREMRIETIQRFESHTLFIASTVTDEFLAEGEQLFHVHGSYQVWRRKQGLSTP
jgi:flavin reductase (DIM6/NTAB) family NADH-FMN oxidoreductase RutF